MKNNIFLYLSLTFLQIKTYLTSNNKLTKSINRIQQDLYFDEQEEEIKGLF